MIRTLTEAEIDATVAALTADLDDLPVAEPESALAPGVRVLAAAQLGLAEAQIGRAHV